MYNNVIITATNSPYFESLLTLISSIHKNGLNTVDKILVYNIGLTTDEINQLSKLKKVDLITFTDFEINQHPLFLEGKSHVYKCYCLYHASKLSNNVLWIDSGAFFLKDFKIIFDIINNDDIFLVGDVHINKTYTHSKCIKIMGATESELSDNHLSSGVIGFKSNGKYQKLIDESSYYSLIEGCCDGDYENHRHDQSVLSILASRYDCQKQDIDTYGYWTDFKRNLITATERGAVIFVHRNGLNDKSNLIYED
jgi:hypothetical protein